jgi:UDP-glucose:(heptosyl)LPS alpha-1,3-glucosyltransferase
VKIGFISHGLGTQGGIESVVQHLATESARQGHAVTVFSATGPAQPIRGLRWVPVRVPKLPWILRQAWFAVASALAVRRHPVDVLQAHVNTFAPAQVAVSHSVHAVGSELVLSMDPSAWRRWRHRLLSLSPLANWLAGVNYRRPQLKAAVATSRGIGRELYQLFPGLEGRMLNIPNGFDPAHRYPAKPSERKRLRQAFGLRPGDVALLFIGKEFHRKGLEPIVRALPLLPARVQLWVIGDNVDVIPASHYKGLVASLGLESRVRFLGHQKDLLAYYQAADAFVFPTLYEAFAMVSIESVACGLPLLATRANGTEDLIVEGKNGVFIERDGASIASAVRRWILPRAKRAALARGAAASAQAYTWRRIARRHLAACRAVQKGVPLPAADRLPRGRA